MKIIVINELPSDIFSEHLLSQKCFQVTRLNFSQMMVYRGPFPELILTVNQSIALAERLKKVYPKIKVAATFGGKSDSQHAFVSFVYGENDHDSFSYSSWSMFEALLLEEQKRPLKKLLYFSEYCNHTLLQLNQDLLNKAETSMNSEFGSFLSKQITLSLAYILGLKELVTELKNLSFPIKVSASKKLISQIKVTLKNEHKGLAIFKNGDRLELLSDKQKIIPLNVRATVSKARDYEFLIKFSKPVSSEYLKKIKMVRLNLAFLSRKLDRMRRDLLTISDWSKSSEDLCSAPASFISSAIYSPDLEQAPISYPDRILLPNKANPILRDPYQVEVLLEMLSSRPISVISGPAGTGKTFVSAVAIEILVNMGFKVLIVSHSNLGADNLLRAVSQFVDNSKLFRFSNDKEVVDTRVRHLLVKDNTGNNDLFNRFLNNEVGMALACTLDGFMTLKDLNDGRFRADYIFYDEAGLGRFPEDLVLVVAAKRKLILTSDNRQPGSIPLHRVIRAFLENRSGVESAQIDNFDQGFFDSLVRLKYLPIARLKQNRRSLPVISNLISSAFYGNDLIAGRFNPYNDGRVLFLDTKKLDSIGERFSGHSLFNVTEVNLLINRFIAYAIKHIRNGGDIMDFAIIVPYEAQESLVKERLRKGLLFNTNFSEQGINQDNIDDVLNHLVKTIRSIHGDERKIIFISLVRSNDGSEVGFFEDVRLLNEAISRAQDDLVIIGNSLQFLNCKHEDVARAASVIIEYTKKRSSYVVLK